MAHTDVIKAESRLKSINDMMDIVRIIKDESVNVVVLDLARDLETMMLELKSRIFEDLILYRQDEQKTHEPGGRYCPECCRE